MDAANIIKGKAAASSIQQLCLLDVPLPNLHMLSVSTDFSTLTVSAAQFIHIFSIDSLTNKVKPYLLAFQSCNVLLLRKT